MFTHTLSNAMSFLGGIARHVCGAAGPWDGTLSPVEKPRLVTAEAGPPLGAQEGPSWHAGKHSCPLSKLPLITQRIFIEVPPRCNKKLLEHTSSTELLIIGKYILDTAVH